MIRGSSGESVTGFSVRGFSGRRREVPLTFLFLKVVLRGTRCGDRSLETGSEGRGRNGVSVGPKLSRKGNGSFR